MAYATYSGGFSITTIQCHQGKLNGSPSLKLNLIEKKVVAPKNLPEKILICVSLTRGREFIDWLSIRTPQPPYEPPKQCSTTDQSCAVVLHGLVSCPQWRCSPYPSGRAQWFSVDLLRGTLPVSPPIIGAAPGPWQENRCITLVHIEGLISSAYLP